MKKKNTPWHKLKMPKSVKKPRFVGLPWISDIRKFSTVLILAILFSCSPKHHDFRVYPMEGVQYKKDIQPKSIRRVTIITFILLTPIVLTLQQHEK